MKLLYYIKYTFRNPVSVIDYKGNNCLEMFTIWTLSQEVEACGSFTMFEHPDGKFHKKLTVWMNCSGSLQRFYQQ